MNRAEALVEAKRRWGAVQLSMKHSRRSYIKRCQISSYETPLWMIRGVGPTWEAAFADADRREKDAKP